MVTVKNLWNGLADQGPFLRFIKNLCKGHIFGLFSKRSHFTSLGPPKVGYDKKETAVKAAKAMQLKKGVYFSNYRCIYCGKYHLGKNRANKINNP